MKWLRRVLIAVLSLIAVTILLELTAHSRGRLAAGQDQRDGKDAIRSLGYAGREAGEYQKLLRERYGVECLWIADCLVIRSQVAYAHGYNEVSRTRIVLKFGKDIFRECREEAVGRWERKRTEEERKR